MVLIVGVNFQRPKHALFFLASRTPLHEGMYKHSFSLGPCLHPLGDNFSGGKEMQHFGWWWGGTGSTSNLSD